MNLPDGSSFDFYEQVIKNNLLQVPAIFLTGQTDLADRMKGLELGAEDYILKPFYNKELSLRIEMRLKQFESQSSIITCGDLKFNKELHHAYLIGAEKPEQALNFLIRLSIHT